MKESNDETLHWPETVGKSDRCVNCGVSRTGAFCPSCGQKHLTKRREFRELFVEMVSKLTDWDRGLLHTVGMLLVRPGTVARDYATGKQRPYISPLAYFFLGAAMQLLALWLIESQLRSLLTENLQMSPEQLERPGIQNVENALGEDFGNALATIYISSIKQAYTYAALFFFCVPFAVFLKILHGWIGEVYRIGETMILALYSVGQMMLVTAFITPIALQIGTGFQTVSGPLAYFVIAMLAHRDFFRPSWSSRLMTGLSLLCSMMIFFSSIVLIFIVSILGRVAMAN